MTVSTIKRTDDCREPDRDSRPPERGGSQVADPPIGLSNGVRLTRLLALTRLTAPQALEIGLGVLAEATRQPEPETQSPESTHFQLAQFLIGADGEVLRGAPADGGPDARLPAPGPAGGDVAALLTEISAAARTSSADPAGERLLAEFDRAVAELPVAGVPAVARRLQVAAAALDRGAVRAELAALVSVLTGGGRASGSGLPARARSTVRETTRAWPATGGASRTAVRRIGAWVLSILVLAAVVLLEIVFLRDDIAVDIRLLLDAGRSGSAPVAAQESSGPTVQAPAPAAADDVAAVDLRPLASCAQDAPCSVRLLVRLVPAAEAQVVTWSYRIVDRCTGATTTAPGGSVAVPPGGERAAAIGTVPLPSLQAVVVFAVTDLPAVAASPPVVVGSCLPDGSAQ
jgi:hypothetical protein